MKTKNNRPASAAWAGANVDGPDSAPSAGREGVSTWESKLKALGPGIMMASAAVGGSHIVASTQAGAMYGWQLAIVIVLANLLKYPFFRFGYEYTLVTGDSLLDGYARVGKKYVWLFFGLNVFSAMVNAGAVLIVCSAILKHFLGLQDLVFVGSRIEMSSMAFLSAVILLASVSMLLAGKYGALDFASKAIMLSLTVATCAAALLAAKNGAQARFDAPAASPWNWAALAFVVSLCGWMPAPIEISAISSLWLKAKRLAQNVGYKDGMFDFNVGFVGTALLALVFMTMGWLVQYRSGEAIELANGSKYIAQLIHMYSSTIGPWSADLVAFIAFACMWGTTITVLDGYSRSNVESVRILLGRKTFSGRALSRWIVVTALVGFSIILFFNSAMSSLLKFAMIASFVTTPVFAFLNFLLARRRLSAPKWLMALAWAGLASLSGFALFFVFTAFVV